LAERNAKLAKKLIWTEELSRAAVMLAEGYPLQTVADEVGVQRTTIWRWRQHPEFAMEVDKLTLMYGLASKAERMRLINQAAKQMVSEEKIDLSGVTFLDLIKEARMQTEGIKLDVLTQLTALTTEAGLVEQSDTGRSFSLPEPDTDETD